MPGVGHMRRREFLGVLGSAAAAWPLAASAQEGRPIARIGVIIPRSAAAAADYVAALKDGLRRLGYVEGRTLIVDWYFAHGSYDRLPDIAGEMIKAGASLLVVGGTTPVMILNKAVTGRPIVFVGVSDPIGAGIAQSLARPGGNATGFATAHEEAYAGKSLELLKEALPSASHVAVLYNPTNPFNLNFLRQVQRAANALTVRIDVIEARNLQELDTAITALAAKSPNALLVATDPFLGGRAHEIVTATTQQKLPAMFGFREYPQAGGLMSYGANLAEMYRRVATYVDRILKGAKPADLPIELPTKFELVINLKTARAIGLEVPPALLARADEVIE
jgi:putative tryptophan/tyrosine transport system substrate-binding protein